MWCVSNWWWCREIRFSLWKRTLQWDLHVYMQIINISFLNNGLQYIAVTASTSSGKHFGCLNSSQMVLFQDLVQASLVLPYRTLKTIFYGHGQPQTVYFVHKWFSPKSKKAYLKLISRPGYCWLPIPVPISPYRDTKTVEEVFQSKPLFLGYSTPFMWMYAYKCSHLSFPSKWCSSLVFPTSPEIILMHFIHLYFCLYHKHVIEIYLFKLVHWTSLDFTTVC